MGKSVLVDTDILLKSYRGDNSKYQQLRLISDVSISVLTALELLNGAKNLKQLASTKKELKAYSVVHLNDKISVKALQLFSKYSVQHQVKVVDLLIGATAIHYNFLLYTDNKKDYRFIKEIKFYEEQV